MSRIAKLWYWGWINPIPPWCFGRNSVFLAIGSVLWNCHIYLKITMALRCHFPFSIFLTSLQQFFTSLHHLFYFHSPFFKFPFRVSFLLPFTIYFISLQSFLLLLSTIFCTSLHHFFTHLQSFFYFTSAFLSAFYFPSAFLLPFRAFLLPFRVFTTLFIYLQCFLLPLKVLLFFCFPSAFFYFPSAF